jgi:hypothetical protein
LQKRRRRGVVAAVLRYVYLLLLRIWQSALVRALRKVLGLPDGDGGGNGGGGGGGGGSGSGNGGGSGGASKQRLEDKTK